MKVNMIDGSLFVHQTNYTYSITNTLNMLYAKELSISIDKTYTVYQQEELEILIEEIPCKQAVGS